MDIISINIKIMDNEIDNEKECSICCEKYTKVQRLKITCSCGAKICKQCIKRYLLDIKDEPHCMSCKKPYDRRFITEHLNISYIKNQLRKHEQKILIDNEMSKMLDTQKHVAAYLAEKKYNEDYAKIMKQETEMIAKIKAETREKLLNLGTLQKKVKKEIVQFKYPCPMEDCRGFVSVKGFCGTCNCRVCTKCNQVMDAEHECNPDDVASFQLIKKETKPCPKCGERIQKISGCDQMWCASEKIPGQPCGCLFSWKTGEIETGKINHNPEYYKFIKNNGLQIRNPGDVVCGGLVPYHIFHNILNRLKGHIKIIHPNEEFKTFSKDLMSMNFKEQPTILTMLRLFHRAIGDLTYVLQRLRRVARGNEDENLRLRIQYSVKEITKEDFAKKVMKINTDKKKAIEILQPLELYNTVGIEQINSIRQNPTQENIMEVCNVILNTSVFIRKELLKSQEGYTGKPYRVYPDFIVRK